MIAVNGKDRTSNIEIGIFPIYTSKPMLEIFPLVTEHLDTDGLIPKGVLPQEFKSFVHCRTRGFVLVVEISP